MHNSPQKLLSHRKILATLIALSLSHAASADYSSTDFFGDSLSDAGTYTQYVGGLYPGSGKFTTNPGPVWSENLAATLGRQATPAVNGGTNYAAGGARVDQQPGYPASVPFIAAAPSVQQQISSYLASNGGVADAHALFSVWAGANDIFALQSGDAVYQAQSVNQVADNLAIQIGRLKNAGARYILVSTLPDIGSTPGSVADGAAASAQATQLSQNYNRELFSQLAAQGIEVIPVDTLGLLRSIRVNAQQFGFINTSSAACASVSSSLICTPSDYAAGTEQTYLFADGVHPTTATHRILSDYVVSILNAPQQIAALPETAIATRTALDDLLRAQLIAGDRARIQQGRNFWIAAQGDKIRRDSDTLQPGIDQSAYQFAMGFDIALDQQWVVGAAFSANNGNSDYSGNRGDFSQQDTTLSAYGSWRNAPWFARGSVSYGLLDYDLNRRVPLGISSYTATGNTYGYDVSLQIEGGYDFTVGNFTHGPVLGISAQDVQVDSFKENDGNVIDLGYGTQSRHPIIGSAAWQFAYRTAACLPYARIGVDRDFKDNDATVTLSQLSIPEAASYDMPVEGRSRTGYTTQLGVTGSLSNEINYNVGATYRFGPNRGNDTQIFAGLSAGF